MVLKSPFPEELVDDRPLHVRVLESCLRSPNKTCVVDGLTSASYTFSDVHRLSYGLATCLHQLGLDKSDVISISLPNCIQYIPLCIGTMITGITASLLNPAYHAYELEHYVSDSASKAIITSTAQLDAFVDVSKKLPRVKFVFVLDADRSLLARYSGEHPELRFMSVQDMLDTKPDFRLKWPKVYTKTDVVLYLYSSGTTGLPKAVMHSHYSISSALTSIQSRAFFYWPTSEDTFLAFLPYFHIYGLIMYFKCLFDNITQLTIPKFEPKRFLELIEEHRIRSLYVVPPVLVFLAKHPMVATYDISSVEMIMSGAAPVGRELSEDICKRLPNVKYLCQGYGMSEHGVCHIYPPVPISKLKHGSTGLLTSNYECKIIDTETGVELPGPNKTGEILVRGPHSMLGYLNQPEQTAKMIDSEGWVHTGDIGYYDDDEFFFIIDRIKELIKCKGFQVAPAELEDVLLQQACVADAAVVGVPDDRDGERPLALVVLKHGHEHTKIHQIIDAVNPQLADYKALKEIRIVEEIPKSPSGKILRRVIRDQLKKERTAKL